MNVFKAGFSCILFFVTCLTVPAQSKKSYDPRYYAVFPKSIVERAFVSKKYMKLTLRSLSGNDLLYIANNSTAAGIGFSYNNLSVNLAYGLGFLRNKDKGKTKNIDLQAHLYSRRWVNDLYAQQYRGFYSPTHSYSDPGEKAYYFRPDIKIQTLGLSRYRVFNSKKYSYRASFLQTEWQKRSAGSLLAGFEMYYSRLTGDSSLVPATIKQYYSQPNINKINYASIGPGIGYAYTLVFDQHFFATAAVIGNLNFSYIKENEIGNTSNHFAFSPLINFRTAVGYGGKIWNISANWIAVNLRVKGTLDNKYLVQTGNYRFIVARRFTAGKKLQKKLRAMDKIFKEGMDKLPG